MRLIGIELQNFRSIGDKQVVLDPLNKFNILIGPNNIGKSNVLRAVKKISDKCLQGAENVVLEDLEYHNRSLADPFIFKLSFEADRASAEDQKLGAITGTSNYWFTFQWDRGKEPVITHHTFSDVDDFNLGNNLLRQFAGRNWSQRPSKERFHEEMAGLGMAIFSSFKSSILPVFYIPEFRQIRQGPSYKYDGQNLENLLAQYQMPPIGKDTDQKKFDKIQEFVRRLLHLPNATLEFPREPASAISLPDPILTIKNNELRLPLSYYGTGVHELIIMVTAVLSKDNALCCIEEPEIHLHPRLQRELIELLIEETSNQYLITTHSPTLINSLGTNSKITLFRLQSLNGATTGGPIQNENAAIQAIRDLGLRPSDLMQANCILWVEGPSDRIFLQHWVELFAPGLIEGRDYMFLYYRGRERLNIDADKFSKELTNVLKLNPNAIVVIDSDRGKEDDEISEIKKQMVEECAQNGGLSWVTDGREIENYLSGRAILKTCKELRNVDVNVSLGRFDDFGQEIDKALRSVGVKPLDYDHNKLNYARKFSEHTLMEDVGQKLKADLNRVISQIKDWNR